MYVLLGGGVLDFKRVRLTGLLVALVIYGDLFSKEIDYHETLDRGGDHASGGK